MNKIKKVFVLIVIIFFVVCVAVVIGLRMYFTQHRLSALIADYSAKYLSREVAFDSVNLSFSGFSIKKLRVSEYPSFSKGEFVSADEFHLMPSLIDLLRGKVVIRSISASALAMRVIETKKGAYNFSDLINHGKTEAADKAQTEKKIPLLVSNLKVRNSVFSYTNADGDLSVKLGKIDLSASGISPDGLFPVDAEFLMDIVSPAFKGSMPVKLKGKVALGNFNIEKGRAEIEKGEISFSGMNAGFNGHFSNLMEPDGKISISVKSFPLSALKGFVKAPLTVPAAEAEADFKIKLTGMNIRSLSFSWGFVRGLLKGSVDWEPKMSYNLFLKSSADIPETNGSTLKSFLKGFNIPPGVKLPSVKLASDVSIKNGRTEISPFSLSSQFFSVSGNTGVDFSGKELKASGIVKAELKDLAKIASAASGMTGQYKPSGAVSVGLDYSYAGKISARGKASLKGVGAAFADHVLSGLSGEVNFTMDSASSAKLTGKLDGQDVLVSFGVKNMMLHPKAEFVLKLARLVLKDQPVPSAEKKEVPAGNKPQDKPFYFDVSGRGEIGAIEHPNFSCGTVALYVNLSNISADMKGIDGSSSFSVGAGKFSELYKFAARYPAAKVALTPMLTLRKISKAAPALKLPDFNNISFEKIEGDYSFDKGLMKINRSSLVSSVADADSSGTVNLPSGKLDIKMKMRLKKDSGVRMSEPIGINITGTMDDPNVKADIKSIVEQPAVRKTVEKVKPAAEKLLRKLFK